MATQSATFAQHATTAVGVTVTVVTAGAASPATNEVVTFIAAGNNGNAVTGGTFTITFGGQTTAGLAFDADGPTTVETAFVGLSSVQSGNADVTGTNINTGYTITFKGTLAATDVGAVTINPASLTGAAYCDIVTLSSPKGGIIKVTNRGATNTITVRVLPNTALQTAPIAALDDDTYYCAPTGITGQDASVVITSPGIACDVYLQCPAKQAYSVESFDGLQ